MTACATSGCPHPPRSTGVCKVCKQREWQQANAARLREYNAQRYASRAEEKKAYARAYYDANREKVKAAVARRRVPNPRPVSTPEERKARKAERNARWSQDNPEKQARAIRAWAKANPDKRQAYGANYRTRKTEAGGSYTAAEWQALVDATGGVCPCCRQECTKFEADHIIPVSMGGPSYAWNIQPLCCTCNRRKSDRMIVAFAIGPR